MKTFHSKRIVFINQSSGTLMVDIVNAFGTKYEHLVLITGTKGGEKYQAGLLEKVKVDKIISYEKNTTFRRIFTWLWGWLQIWFKIILKYRKADLFIVSNPPMATLLPLFCRNPYSFLIYDTYPDVLVSTGVCRADSFIVRWWKKQNRKLYRKARNIYTIGEGMAECLTQYTEKEKIKIIPNWADVSFLKPCSKADNPFLKEYGLSDKFIVLYSGNLGNTHSVETIVEVAERLRYEQDICFVIIGEGGKKKKIGQMVEEKGLNNCRLLPWQPVERIPYSLGAADVGVITLDLSASALSVPSKTYAMLAVGCALLCIAGRDSELGGIVGKYQAGEIFAPDEVDRIADFVLGMKNDAEKLERYKRNARKAALDFTPENARQYVNRYE